MPPSPPAPSQSNIPTPPSFALPTVPVATYEFHPTLHVSERYTDNFFLTATNRQENFRTTVGPGFNLLVNTPRTQGSATAVFDFAYDTVDGERHFNFFPRLSGSLRWEATPRLTLTLTESLVSSDDSAETDSLGVRARERRRVLSNSLGLLANLQLDTIATQAYYRQSMLIGSSEEGSSGSLDDSSFTHVLGANASMPVGVSNTVRVGYELSFRQTGGPDSNNDSDDHTQGDSIGHLFLASFSRQLSEFATAGVSTSYSLQSRGNSRIWNVSVFASYGLPTGLSVSSSVGVSLLNSDDVDNRVGFSTNTNVSYLFGQVLATLGVFQDFRQTSFHGEDQGIVLSRAVTAGLSFPMTPATSGSIRVSYVEQDPLDSNSDRGNATTRVLSGTATISSVFFSGGIRASRGENQLVGRINDARQEPGDTISVGAFVTIPIFLWLNMTMDYDRYMRMTSPSDIIENRASIAFRATF